VPRPNRLAIVHGVLVLFAAALVAQLAKVQIVHGREWADRGRQQHFFSSSLAAYSQFRAGIFRVSFDPLPYLFG